MVLYLSGKRGKKSKMYVLNGEKFERTEVRQNRILCTILPQIWRRRKMNRKLLASVMALCMTLSMVPCTAFAADSGYIPDVPVQAEAVQSEETQTEKTVFVVFG